MRRFKDIIEDIKAPSPQSLWLNNGELKVYGANGWTPISIESSGEPSGELKFQYIQEIPDIIIEIQ